MVLFSDFVIYKTFVQMFFVTEYFSVLSASPKSFINFQNFIQGKVLNYNHFFFCPVVPYKKLRKRGCDHQVHLDHFNQLNDLGVNDKLRQMVLPFVVEELNPLNLLHTRSIINL